MTASRNIWPRETYFSGTKPKITLLEDSAMFCSCMGMSSSDLSTFDSEEGFCIHLTKELRLSQSFTEGINTDWMETCQAEIWTLLFQGTVLSLWLLRLCLQHDLLASDSNCFIISEFFMIKVCHKVETNWKRGSKGVESKNHALAIGCSIYGNINIVLIATEM